MTSTIPAHAVGDIVRVVPTAEPRGAAGALYEVTAIPGGSRKNLSVDPIEGGRGMKGDPSLFVPVDEETATAARQRIADRQAEGGAPTLGSVVRLTAPSSDRQRGLFVVIKADNGKATLARLGGITHADPGWRGIALSSLRVVPVTAAVVAAFDTSA